jgi:hypothetical protein
MLRIKPFIISGIVFLLFSCSGRRDSQSIVAYKDIDFTEQLRTTKGWIAGDGAYSIPIGENKSLWTFGDSYIDSFDTLTKSVPCLFQARNAAMVIGINNPSQKTTLRSTGATPTLFTFGTDNKYWFWPTSGLLKNDTVYVFLSRLRNTGEGGMWAFAGVDTNYVAKLSSADLSVIEYGILPATDSIVFGVSVIEQSDYTYIYGIKPNGFGNDLFVARFSQGKVYSEWEYFTGEEWSADIKKIKKIHSEFTASFYLCKLKEKYVLITTEFSVDCDQGKNIYAATADSPYGPFTNQHPVWQVNDTLNGHYPFFYMANGHPEYDNGRDELLITYCINGYGTCVETCVDNRMNPDVYRPKAIRVPYGLLFEKL